MRCLRILLFICCLNSLPLTAAQQTRPFGIDEALKLKDLSDPRLSPDEQWAAYTVRTLDLKKDKRLRNLSMVSVKTGERIQLTRGESSDDTPRWSPDGGYLGFLSNRLKDRSQIFLFDRRGGEPYAITELKSSVSDFEWSPDSKRIAFIAQDPDPDKPDEEVKQDKERTDPPVVINRLQFKRDGVGFVKELYDHLYVLDLKTRGITKLTSGPYDASSIAWSPDGQWIAFESNRTLEPDSNSNTDIWIVSSTGGDLVQVTTNPGSDASPAWSPDGQEIAHVSVVNPEKMWYATQHLAITTLESKTTEVLTKSLDRNVSQPFIGSDNNIYFLLEDSGDQHLARFIPGSRKIERIITGAREVTQFDLGNSGRAVITTSDAHYPEELFLYKPTSELSRLTSENVGLLEGIQLAQVEDIQFESGDGTSIEGYVIKPPNFQQGQRYPTLLWNHGGPVAQFAHTFDEQWHTLAGAGFLVVSANPRGSSGYGEAFSHTIWAAWGQKDFKDVMAAVDHVIELGYADPDRLGVGGWSYGGILTNYVITQTDRFKAASPGASETNYLACYGTDHYQYEWETELGLPWENRELYLKLSPLTSVEKIVTPTLIMCGEHDWNVPLNQSEQLYQSLRRLGRETQLIVYPGQGHSIATPSYQKDRFERYLKWFGEKLGLAATTGESGS